jgi:hypothetical protein
MIRRTHVLNKLGRVTRSSNATSGKLDLHLYKYCSVMNSSSKLIACNDGRNHYVSLGSLDKGRLISADVN